MLRHIKDGHGDVKGVGDQHHRDRGLEDPLEDDPGLEVRQVVVVDGQLDELIAGNKRQDHACYGDDDTLRNVPDHGEDPGRKVLGCVPHLGRHIGDLLVHGVEHPREVVHDAVHQHPLQPVSDLVKNRLHALPPESDSEKCFCCCIYQPSPHVHLREGQKITGN